MSPTCVNPFNFIISARKSELVGIESGGMTMANNYEAPEVFELAKPKEVILGTKGYPDTDPETGEPEFEVVTEEQLM